MIVQYDPDFLKKYKQVDVRIRKSFKKVILIFSNDPYDPRLRNHVLRAKYKGLRSIDITSDWRAIYDEIYEAGEEIAYFTLLGTHAELYK